jgi:hypothetical protein
MRDSSGSATVHSIVYRSGIIPRALFDIIEVTRLLDQRTRLARKRAGYGDEAGLRRLDQATKRALADKLSLL